MYCEKVSIPINFKKLLHYFSDNLINHPYFQRQYPPNFMALTLFTPITDKCVEISNKRVTRGILLIYKLKSELFTATQLEQLCKDVCTRIRGDIRTSIQYSRGELRKFDENSIYLILGFDFLEFTNKTEIK